MHRPLSSLLRFAIFTGLATFGSAQFDPQAEKPIAPLPGTVFVFADEASDGLEGFLSSLPEYERRLTLVQGAEVPEAGDLAAAGLIDLQANEPLLCQEWLEAQGLDLALIDLLRRGGTLVVPGQLAGLLGECYTTEAGGSSQHAGLSLVPGVQFELATEGEVWVAPKAGIVQLCLRGAGVLRIAGRRIEARGDASARLAPGPNRPEQSIELGKRPADLLSLSRAAVHRAAGPWPRALLAEPNVKAGALTIVGGGGLGSEIGARFLELAGGPDAPVVYIPCTSELEVALEPRMCSVLRSWGFRDVTWVHTKDRARADTDETILGPLRKARAIWFGGGRQWNFVDSWLHTKSHRLMHAVLEKGGVIGGSSAGASIQAEYMCRGNPLGNLDIMAEGYEEGLGFLTGCGVDQHFTQRGRQPDMASMVKTFPQVLGIGIDEGTALLVQGSRGEVLGPHKVWFYDGQGDSPPVGVAAGGSYDLAARALSQDAASPTTPDPWVTFVGTEGPGFGKHIVLIAGDEEYRSEEALPMLAQVLAKHHGFRCTVLFSSNPEDGTIDPMNQTHIPGLELLDDAHMVIVGLRFRELPDADMGHFVDFIEAGKPVLGLRASTHAFDYTRNRESEHMRYTWRGSDWKGGFGKQILGETWVAHHGGHGSEATLGVVNEAFQEHPILKGKGLIFGPTDVYRVGKLPADAQVLVWGQVLAGMQADSPPVAGPKNDPMMPLIWVREFEGPAGKTTRAICSTLGASQDFSSPGLRRVVVNACYWGLGMEELIPEQSVVDFVTPYEPTPFGYGKFRKGVRPHDLAW
ncbi:MAG: cyanophycinase [Planctomycetota bacterium]|jgi:cyanophycinase